MYDDSMPEDTAEATGVAGEAEEAAAALLTAAQVAQALGISTRRLRDWRKEGRITEVGRFKRGTARIPLFDPADMTRLQQSEAAEEAPATVVATVASPVAFAEAVAHQVRQLLTERAAAEAAAVAPLVALVREQQETIDDLRRQLAEAHSIPPAAPPPPGAAPTPSAATATPVPHAPAQGLWARLRRAFGGE